MTEDTQPAEPVSTITVEWEDEKTRRAICYNFRGLWEWFDFSHASTQAFRMMTEVEHRVGLIFNFRYSLDMPPTGAMPAIQRLLEFAPENMDLIIIASDDKITQQAFVNLLKLDKTLREYITFAKSCDDALDLLEQYQAQRVR
jgi:hypothetical protein